MGLTLLIAITFSVLIFFLTSIAVFVTRRRYYRNAPVVVTSATHSAPGVYCVTQMTAGATTPAFSTSYPPQGIPSHMPMRAEQFQAAGFQQNVTAFSTMSSANMNPPSYDVAVSSTIINEK